MRSVAMLAAGVVLLGGASAGHAADVYPATSFFDGGLSPESSWTTILATPQVEVDRPSVPFGAVYVPVTELCTTQRALHPIRTVALSGPAPPGAGHYVLSVYRVLRNVLNPYRVFLFEKEWDVPPCGGQRAARESGTGR